MAFLPLNNLIIIAIVIAIIPRALKRSGTYGKKRGSMSTSFALMLIKYIFGSGL